MRDESLPAFIALLTHSVNPRGGVVHTLELASALTALGHDVTVFVPAAPGETLFRVPRVPGGVCADHVASQANTVAMVEARVDAFQHALIDHGCSVVRRAACAGQHQR